MNRFIERHGQTIFLVVAAALIFYAEYRAVPDYTRWQANAFQNPFLVAMGKWGIRFLLLSLAITPVYTLTNWRFITRMRKPAGLLAFAFVVAHVAIYVFYPVENFSERLSSLIVVNYLLYGFIPFVILLLLTATSVKAAQKLLGRNWKRLHRMVYIAGIFIMLHSITVATTGKRAVMGGAESVPELLLYAVILAVLLALRVPIIKTAVKRLTGRGGRGAGKPSAERTPAAG